MTLHQNPKLEQQRALEDEMRGLGIERYRKEVSDARENKQETRTKPVRRLLVEAHSKVTDALAAFVKTAKSGKAGRKHEALRLVEQVKDPDMLAYLALRQVLDAITTRETLNSTAMHLGTLIEDELHYRAFEEKMPGAYNATVKRLRERSDARFKRLSATQTARKLGVGKPTGWQPRDKLLLGVKLIELVIEATGLVQTKVRKMGAKNTPIVLEATEATREWIDGENQRLEWLAPVFMPCVMPPKDWTTPFTGAYHSPNVRKLTLVKTRSREYLDELAHNDMPEVYSSINALQHTAWAINRRILGVMRGMWEAKIALGVIPEGDNLPMPNKPGWLDGKADIKAADMTPEQLEEFKQWKRSSAQVHEGNARMVCKRLSFSRMLWVAEKFSGEEELFYPYQLDFRGRVYPVALYLHPQGDDAQRALLQFSNEVPINDADGALWLAVHGAGCWGVDKLSLEAREAWVFDNEANIIACAADPMANRFWTEAEKPWQALAFCFDWAGYRREGFGYLSTLPIQMDGTCNGLQNFSAILRDEIGGAAVNLVPNEKPQDIYAKVAEVVIEVVKRDAIEDDAKGALARQWLGHIDRKLCKRPVMTLPYGAKAYGFKQMVFDDTVAPWRMTAQDTFPFADNGWSAAEYMGGLIYECVGRVVVAAKQAMDWLQDAARIAAKEGQPVNWRTPTGLVVQQAYRVPNAKRIELTFDKVRLQLTLTASKEKIDSRKQASGISPNWVHSLDASHMTKTVNACHALGVRSFCFIHDSYGTHAGNAGVLAQVLREEFVKMYSERDVLADFARDLKAVLPEGRELPPLPEHGSLNLSLVLESPFFFA